MSRGATARLLRLGARAACVCAMAATAPAEAAGRGAAPVLHEPIPPDPAEDLAMHVSLDGDLPAAIRTSGGIVGAPDPLRPPAPSDATYEPGSSHDAFSPDRDTHRPEVSDYRDPFTPSTAPFKRLEAFDAVRADYRLQVRDERLVRVQAGQNGQSGAQPGPDEDAFYLDLVADLSPDQPVRIPSVGPGTRIVLARLGVGAREVPFRVVRDGADNWFLELAAGSSGLQGAHDRPTRARLVTELAIGRAALGGPLADVAWSELPFVAPLPENVTRDAGIVRAAIGVSRAMRPRDAIAKLVAYFRGFTDSDDPPRSRGSIYLDLALSKKGVCRHRAFAFLVTAQSLGIPTRMVINEAHAWVEVHDGSMWRRIDLGGAGRLAPDAAARRAEHEAYVPPAEAFAWPAGASRNDDLGWPGHGAGAATASASAGGGAGNGANGARGPGGAATPGGAGRGGSPGGAGGPGAATSGAGAGGVSSASASASPRASMQDAQGDDERPRSTITLVVADAVAHRGGSLHVRGEVTADGDPCSHVAVELWLRRAASGVADLVQLGTVATGDDGTFAGSIVVTASAATDASNTPGTTPTPSPPSSLPLGDYDVVARTAGSARCGAGGN